MSRTPTDPVKAALLAQGNGGTVCVSPQTAEILESSSPKLKKRTALPEDLAYLADCSDAMLDNFILERMNSAAQHSRAIQAEQRAMVNDLAKAEAARLIKLLLDDREMLDLLLSRRKIRNRTQRPTDKPKGGDL